MHKELRPEQIDILVGSPAVNDEFSRKVRELDRRLQANGMSYRQWDTLNDRQHDIFSNDMFLDGECATSVKDYVMGAVDSCWCPDVVEDLEHHSPVLMREIEKQQDMLPDVKVKIGESLNNLNETIDLLLENIILQEFRTPSAEEYADIEDMLDNLGDPKTAEELHANVSKIALDMLEQEYGAGWFKNEGDWAPGAGKTTKTTLRQEGRPGRMWSLSNGGNRTRRNRILQKIREEIRPLSLVTSISEEDDDPKYKDGGEVYRLSVKFQFPIQGEMVEVPWELELAEGMGAGGTVEDTSITGLSAELERAITENNGQPVTLVFYEGPEGAAKNVMTSIKITDKRPPKGQAGHTGRSGDPKTDIVLKDAAGKTVYSLSHKKDGGASAFNQWGGVSDFIKEGYEKDFVAFARAAAEFLRDDRAASKTDGDPTRHMRWVQDGDNVSLQMEKPGTWPMGFALAGLAGDPILQINAIFGLDAYSRSSDGKIVRNPQPGIDNVDAVVSGPMKLEKIEDGVYRVNAPKIFGPGQLTDTSPESIQNFIDGENLGSDYAPVLMLRRAGGTRKVPGYSPTGEIPGEPLGINRGRFGLFPAANRDITHFADRNEGEDGTVTYTIRSVLEGGDAYIRDNNCQGWMCRGKAMEDLGGSRAETLDVKGTEQIRGFDLDQQSTAMEDSKGQEVNVLRNDARPKSPVKVGTLASKGGPWGKTFGQYKRSVESVLQSGTRK